VLRILPVQIAERRCCCPTRRSGALMRSNSYR